MLGRAVGHRRGLRSEGVQPGSDVGRGGRCARAGGGVLAVTPFGDEDHRQHSHQQDGALQHQGGAVDGQRLQHRGAAGRRSCLPTMTTATNAAISPPIAMSDLGAVADSSGQERLHQHPDHGNTEDDEYR